MDWDNVDLLIVFWETILFNFLFHMNILINRPGVAVRSRCRFCWGYDDVDVNYIGQFNLTPIVTPSPHPHPHAQVIEDQHLLYFPNDHDMYSERVTENQRNWETNMTERENTWTHLKKTKKKNECIYMSASILGSFQSEIRLGQFEIKLITECYWHAFTSIFIIRVACFYAYSSFPLASCLFIPFTFFASFSHHGICFFNSFVLVIV